MKLKKYLSLTRVGIIESLQFRLATVIMVIGNLLYLIADQQHLKLRVGKQNAQKYVRI